MHNYWIHQSVRAVTGLACASPAPARPAGDAGVIFARETPYPAYSTTDTRISHPRYPRRGRTMSHLPGINFPYLRNRINGDRVLLVRSINQEVVIPKPATTKMSSKGQVVIPEEIRQRLGLKPGVQFVVVGERDVVILKTIALPSMRQFDELVAEARRQARKEGMKRSDVVQAVAAARGQR